MINYGFNLYGAREISIRRDSAKAVGELFSAIIAIKGAIFLAVTLIAGLFVFASHGSSDGNSIKLFAATYCATIFEVLFPVWYYQGLEKMKALTVLTFTGRILYFVIILLVVQSPDDYIRVPIVNAGSLLFVLAATYTIIVKRDGLHFRFPSFREVALHARGASAVFVANISVGVLADMNKLLIGKFVNAGSVGAYDVAEKITRLMMLPQVVINQAVYPQISRTRSTSELKRWLVVSTGLAVILLAAVAGAGKYLVAIVAGKSGGLALAPLQILACTVPVIAVSSVFGTLGLLAFGHDRDFRNGIVQSVGVYGILVAIGGVMNWLSVTTFAWIILFTQCFVAGVFCWKSSVLFKAPTCVPS